jgi:hypothetical protein
MTRMNNEELAAALYTLYSRLVEEHQFQGDVSLDMEGNIQGYEDKFSQDYYIDDFTQSNVEEIITAFQKYRSIHAATLPPLMIISRKEAQSDVAKHFKRKPALHWYLSAVDLKMQKTFITEVDPNVYDRAAWKIWYISAPNPKHDDEWPSTDCFYIAMPLSISHMIR